MNLMAGPNHQNSQKDIAKRYRGEHRTTLHLHHRHIFRRGHHVGCVVFPLLLRKHSSTNIPISTASRFDPLLHL